MAARATPPSKRSPHYRPRPRHSSACSASWEYARELFEAVSERVLPLFEASYEAAIAAGDIAVRPGRPRNLFWFAQHVPAMLALAGLPAGPSGRNCVPCDGTLDELADEATAFVLRGIGMRDNAIAADADRGHDAAAD